MLAGLLLLPLVSAGCADDDDSVGDSANSAATKVADTSRDARTAVATAVQGVATAAATAADRAGSAVADAGTAAARTATALAGGSGPSFDHSCARQSVMHGKGDGGSD